MKEFPSGTPKPGQVFRHLDGGIYVFRGIARHSEGTEPLYIYEHLWPFDASEPWARPAAEWASRFTPITAHDVYVARKGNRLQAQRAVTVAKAARRKAQEARMLP